VSESGHLHSVPVS